MEEEDIFDTDTEIISESEDDCETIIDELDEIDLEESFDIPNNNLEFPAKSLPISWTVEKPHPSRRQISNTIDNSIFKYNGLTEYSKDIQSKVQAFSLFLTSEMIDHICIYTNQRTISIDPEWIPVDNIEMYAFIGAILFCSATKRNKENVNEIWKYIPGKSCSFFYSTFPRDRFKQLLKFIRFDDTNTREVRYQRDEKGRPQNKIAPISQLWNMLIHNCKKAYVPGPMLCIDEQLQAFRGRCRFKVYNPNKPARYGIQYWLCNDVQTSYVWNGQIYQGAKDGKKEVNQGKRVVLDLVEGLYPGCGIVADNKFTGFELGVELFKKKITLNGTMRKIRKELPIIVQASKDRPIESSMCLHFKPDEKNPNFRAILVSYVPKKNKAVIMFSTQHQDLDIDVANSNKPQVIIDYNKGKGGVDTFDRILASMNCYRSTNRYSLCIFYNMINISYQNSFVISVKANVFNSTAKYKRRQFVEELAYDLCIPQMKRRNFAKLPKYIKEDIKSIFEYKNIIYDFDMQEKKKENPSRGR
ncbi:hypothetical protein BLOT_009874 [Blomia tropicalis]|nr:hypothetical protein BLOT_009874 [Blomia tropicalis]